eukprot:RCo014598
MGAGSFRFHPGARAARKRAGNFRQSHSFPQRAVKAVSLWTGTLQATSRDSFLRTPVLPYFSPYHQLLLLQWFSVDADCWVGAGELSLVLYTIVHSLLFFFPCEWAVSCSCIHLCACGHTRRNWGGGYTSQG